MKILCPHICMAVGMDILCHGICMAVDMDILCHHIVMTVNMDILCHGICMAVGMDILCHGICMAVGMDIHLRVILFSDQKHNRILSEFNRFELVVPRFTVWTTVKNTSRQLIPRWENGPHLRWENSPNPTWENGPQSINPYLYWTNHMKLFYKSGWNI